MEKLRRDMHSIADLRLYAERLPTSERQELLCAVCLAQDGAEKGTPDPANSSPVKNEPLEISCPLFRGGQRLCGQSK